MQCTNGLSHNLKDFRNKIVMLQFTASWCGVCRKEMPYIENEIWQYHQLKNPDKFIVIGIDRDEPLETVKKFIEQTGVTYPISLDANAAIFGLFADKKSGVTRNIIINSKGKIVHLTRLFDKEEFDTMKTVISELIDEL